MQHVPPRPKSIGARRGWLLAIVLAALWAASSLGVTLGGLVPTGSGLGILSEFLSAGLSPAVDYEVAVPAGTKPLLWKVFDAMRRTLIFAASGLSLALLLGFPLGLIGSTSWWKGQRGARGERFHGLKRWLHPTIFLAIRTGIALLRSIHELLWAVLLLAALGLSSFSAVCAIALPFAGTFAKVFSDILDEAPRDSADVLRASGATELQAFLFGLLPRALPDMAGYSFYRFECAVRSSAVLGFFGYPTVGYYLKLAFDNKRYHEVWSYLWSLIALVFVLEAVSGALRRRVVVR
jgi:ABC-type phosphate/phosphonate transport system permease subunit